MPRQPSSPPAREVNPGLADHATPTPCLLASATNFPSASRTRDLCGGHHAGPFLQAFITWIHRHSFKRLLSLNIRSAQPAALDVFLREVRGLVHVCVQQSWLLRWIALGRPSETCSGPHSIDACSGSESEPLRKQPKSECLQCVVQSLIQCRAMTF